MDLSLNGKRAVITGGSKGIGLGVARSLAAEGVDLLLAARSGDRLQVEAERIAADFGVSVTPVACDLSDSNGQASLAEVALGDRLDIVVNNAGAIPVGSITDIDEASWREGWDLKVFGYINLIRLLLPEMKAAGSGVILNIIGVAADRPNAGYIAGAAGNSALVGLTKALGATSLRSGVRVLAVNPGFILTDRLADMFRQQALERFDDAERWNEMVPTDPPPGTVEQISEVVTFLVSDRASHVSGTVLTIDGGASARP